MIKTEFKNGIATRVDYNENHGEDGRFTESGGGSSGLSRAGEGGLSAAKSHLEKLSKKYGFTGKEQSFIKMAVEHKLSSGKAGSPLSVLAGFSPKHHNAVSEIATKARNAMLASGHKPEVQVQQHVLIGKMLKD